MSAFSKGLRDGLPIGMGYMAVAFSLGIISRNAGLTPAIGFFSSFFTRASAGELGVYSLIAVGATIAEMVLVCIIANLRYLLMSASLTQKFDPSMPMWKRALVACCVTDEVYGISIAYPGRLPMAYPTAAMLLAGAMWGAGNALGIVAGNILPVNVVSALSVALYGMFIAVFVPPCRKNKAVLIAVASSFAISWLCSALPGISSISSGIRIVILTIVIATVAAIIHPVDIEDEGTN